MLMHILKECISRIQLQIPAQDRGRSNHRMSRTDTEWTAQLSGQPDATALADLRDLLVRGLRFALTSYRVTESDLEDFVQDGMVKILQNLASYRAEARFTTWAQKVCVRVALTELRRQRWHDVSLDDLIHQSDGADFTPHVLTDTRRDPGEVTSMQMMMATIQRIMMEELTDLQRTALQAVMQGEMPLQEVAERLGTNRNALYKLLHDARQRLKQRMLAEGLSPQDLLAMFD
jgi:RNA polymerase sigma-70 factor, ECF subfamily